MALRTLHSGETIKLLPRLHCHVSHLVFFFFFLRNRESYEIPPDLKIGDIQMPGNIHEKFEKESPAIEEVI